MQTTTIHYIDGFSKAKTAKAILVNRPDFGDEAWIPLSFASVRFTGPNYQVRVSVPGWLFRKISWKAPTPRPQSNVAKAAAVVAPAADTVTKNPYIGMDYGNMMEEQMILNEQLSHMEYEYGMYQDSDDETVLKEMFSKITELKLRLKQISEACNELMR